MTGKFFICRLAMILLTAVSFAEAQQQAAKVSRLGMLGNASADSREKVFPTGAP